MLAQSVAAPSLSSRTENSRRRLLAHGSNTHCSTSLTRRSKVLILGICTYIAQAKWTASPA